MISSALRLHLYHRFARLSMGLTDQLWGQNANYRKLTSFSQQALAVWTCPTDLWEKKCSVRFCRGWIEDVRMGWKETALCCGSFVRVLHKAHSLSLYATLFILIWKDGEASRLSACPSARRLEACFLGRVCARCVCCFYSSVCPRGHRQHEGTRPNTLGLDLKFNLHSRAIFTLIHVSRTWMSFFFNYLMSFY